MKGVYHKYFSTWYTSSQRDDCDGRDLVFESGDASEMRCHVSNDGRQEANANDGYDKGWPSFAFLCKWTERCFCKSSKMVVVSDHQFEVCWREVEN